uniref:RNA helicase n=1 Tax=Neogobius melanostomus TaxID=47308 RepID=A0A8C6TUJ0_9GOBI
VVESPACIWGRVEGGPGGDAQTMGQYDHLTAQMNLFYHDVTQDQHKLKHTTLEKEQICVAFSPTLKSWCRAKIEAVITDSVSCQVRSSSQTEAVLHETEEDSISIQLFLMFGSIKVCANDELVAKKFAYYSKDPAAGSGLDDEDRKPVMLSSSIINHVVNYTTPLPKSVPHSPPPAGKRKELPFESDAALFKWFFSVLLEWLNPEPLKADVDSEEVEAAPAVDPQKDLHLVHSVFPLEPCQSLDDTPITDQLRRLIQRKLLYSLSPADRYSWPAVARGCNTLIVSPNAGQPISYLPPLLTHVLKSLPFLLHLQPIVVVVCPGWQKAQAIFDLLEETKVSNSLHPMIINVGVKKDEAKSVKIPKNCLLIITTPFSFVRVLSHHCFLFLRIYHLVLDEADQLFTLASEQMTTILQHFQKVVSSGDKAACPQQIVAVSKQWTSQMEALITGHMPHPSIIITIPEEAALYANLQQVSRQKCLESSKINVLLGTLDFNPDVGQKTLIITSSPREADDVFEAVRNKSAFCMKSHEGLTHEFDFVVQQWKKSIGPGTHVVLVTTNECLRCLGICDATCVVHYGFPASPRKFGSRLFSMVKNFRNLTKPDKVDTGRHLARSVLLISERNARHVVGVLRYLGRTGAPLPPELLSFAQSVTAAREDQKTNKPLCSHLKSFGACRDSSVCPDRHSWNPHLDKSELPASGVIEVVPLFIKTASVFYGRIVTKEENDFESLAAAMTLFYADKKPGATEVLAGALYAVQEEKDFHRVKVLSIPDRGDRLFFTVFVQFIDVGKREEVKAHQLLQLPEQFQSDPGQAVEIIVCRVKPGDSERDWHPKVTRAISQKIKGLQHRVRVVLTLGNTVFADPMVRVTQVPGMKTLINEYSLQSEILSSGMAESNPDHINLLKALCHADSADGSNKLSAFRAAEVKNLAADRPQLELLCPTSIINKPPLVTLPPSPLPLHPAVRWYQSTDSLMVTLKLSNPEAPSCQFSSDRVVFRGRVNSKWYEANLELHRNIDTDRCSWKLKANEPVLTLVKETPTYWEKLVKAKKASKLNDLTFASGQCFVEDIGEHNFYVNSETDSD